MAFETDAATVYQIRPHHRHEEVPEVIPADDDGVMDTDRGRSSEAQAFDGVQPQKCLAHLQRSIRDVLDTQRGRARDFGEQRKTWLQDALLRWHAPRESHVAAFKAEAEALQAAMTSHRRDRRRHDPDHQRRLNELGWHHDRGHRLRFLPDPRIEPTNNRAEVRSVDQKPSLTLGGLGLR
jgi:Transposase IS66 family